MLTLSNFKRFPISSRDSRNYSRKIKAGISGFKMTEIQRRTVVWLAPAARFVWGVTKGTVGTFVTRKLGQRWKDSALIVLRKPAEVGAPSAAARILSYYSAKEIGNVATYMRGIMVNLARLVYTVVLSVLTIVSVELYHLGNLIVASGSLWIMVGFNYGKDLLTSWGVTLTDFILVLYSGFYGFLILSIVLLVLRTVYVFLYNMFYLRFYLASHGDVVVDEIQKLEQVQLYTRSEQVQKFINRSELVNQVKSVVPHPQSKNKVIMEFYSDEELQGIATAPKTNKK
jgi:hypothetical protein